MDRKLPPLEAEIIELKGDLKNARQVCSDLQAQLAKQSTLYEQLKEKKEKYQADCTKKEKTNQRLRQEKEDLEKMVEDLGNEVERL